MQRVADRAPGRNAARFLARVPPGVAALNSEIHSPLNGYVCKPRTSPGALLTGGDQVRGGRAQGEGCAGWATPEIGLDKV